jgi:metal-dependent amidase/aminoacylase/carboxypeptidase family protein
MKPAFVLFIFMYSYVGLAQTVQNQHSVHDQIQHQAEKIFGDLVNIRRDIYRHPELSGQEKRTAKLIEAYLLNLGLEVRTNIGGYGVLGILRGGKPGKKIAWRADIDALPSNAPDTVSFTSTNKGVRHICGHDVHTAIALGIAQVLTSQKDNLSGTVYFIFQPAEETYQGAKSMIRDGLFNQIKPDEIYALHVAAFPQGFVATKAQNLYSHTNRVQVGYKLSRNNAAITDFTKNLINRFQNVDPDSPFWQYENLGDPEIGLESPQTIFRNYITVNPKFAVKEENNQLLISTTINSSNKGQLDSLLRALKRTIRKSAYAADFISAEYTYEKATVMNDESLTRQTIRSIAGIYGESAIIPLHGVLPGDIGDDFAYFQAKVPGVYFFLGGSDFENGVIADPHSPDFAVDEQCIKTGVQVFASMIVERLVSE